MRSRHISCIITASPERVYDFAAEPGNLPKWAEGLTKADVLRDGDDLIVDSPMGEVRVHFLPRNELGVMDHDVTLPSGTTVNNPLRVIGHPEGAEVIFTIRQIQMSDEGFDRDCQMVANDLDRLKRIIET